MFWGMRGDRSVRIARGSRVVPARSMRAVLVLATLVAAVAATPGAQAAVDRRLERTRGDLRALSSELDQRVAAAEAVRAEVAGAAERIGDATRQLGVLLASRIAVADQLRDAQARYEAARTELSDLAVRTFMQAPGQSPEAMAFTAALGAGSLTEVGDSIAYAAAIGDDRGRVAARVDIARTRLDTRSRTLDELLVARSQALQQLEDARAAQIDALAAHETAVAELDEARDELVALVSRLSERARASALGGVGAAFRGEYHVSYGRWAQLFLEHMDLPTCRSNRIVVIAWQVQESTKAAWNPLATTRRMPGSTDFNWVGVQNFVSLRQGLEATRGTIENGYEIYRYGAIVEALASCAAPLETARAIAASSWCPGCLQGMYVVGVVPRVEADYATYAAI
jgi:hypothetical protein